MVRNRVLHQKLMAGSAPAAGGCRIWRLGPDRKGAIYWQGRSRVANRLAWQAAHGPVPAGRTVRTRCGNPGCIADAHLYLARNAGEGHPHAILSETDVRIIRAILHHAIESQTALGRRFNVHKGTISDIHTRRTWKHI